MSSEFSCPRCSGSFSPFEINEETVEVCSDCGGIWLKKGQLDTLFPDHEGNLEFSSLEKDHEHHDKYPAVMCPSCDKALMAKINFLEFSDIIYDRCNKCESLFLDREELDQSKTYLEKIETDDEEYGSWSRFLYRLNQASYTICK